MSSGHFHADVGFGKAEADKVMDDKSVRKAFNRPVSFDWSWDIPYLAGYSKDGRTIFFDRHLPKMLKITTGGRFMAVAQFLQIHERWEKALIDVLGWLYAAAHEVATRAERTAVEKAGYNWKAYESALKPYIKTDEGEPLMRVPPNLDLTPYKGETALLARMRKAMDHPGKPGKVSKFAADYGPGMAKAHCSECVYFRHGNACAIVAGEIDPNGWCRWFKKE